jgi:hypothetical protein
MVDPTSRYRRPMQVPSTPPRPIGPLFLPGLLWAASCSLCIPAVHVSEGAYAYASLFPTLGATAGGIAATVALIGVRAQKEWGPQLLVVAMVLAVIASAYALWHHFSMYSAAIRGADAPSKVILRENARQDLPWVWTAALIGLVPPCLGGGAGFVWMRRSR